MLTTPPDLAPDPAVPHRDRVLDPVATASRLAALRLLGDDLAPGELPELVRAKYRIGESVRATYRVRRRDGGCALVTVRSGAQPPSAATGDVSVLDTRLAARWWVFPHDRAIRSTRRIMAVDAALAAELGLDGWRSSTVVEYAAERTLTVRADGAADGPVAYVKAYAPGTVDVGALADRYRAVAARFAAVPNVVTPGVVGVAPGVLALEPVAGDTWARSPSRVDLRLLRRLGAAIAVLHGAELATAVPRFGRLRVDRVVESARLVAVARPDVRRAVDRLAMRLSAGAPPGERVLLHGDCHPKNLIVDGGSIALVDLDQAGSGDPACDLASFAARELHGVLLGEDGAASATARVGAVLEGYRSHRELPDQARMCWHLAAALVAERAIRAVNRVRRPHLAILADTVALAADVLDRWPFPAVPLPVTADTASTSSP